MKKQKKQPENIRVLVCGGRNFSDVARLKEVLEAIHKDRGIGTIVHGAARGADTLAAKWAMAKGIIEERHPARWSIHGKAAGPIRNTAMIESGVDLAVAFPGGAGTSNMIELTKKYGVDIIYG